MLNVLWAVMILVGLVFAALQGRLTEVTNAALDSSKEAIALCMTMLGVLAFWMGLMEIATKAGIIQTASRMLAPVIRFFFPRIPRGHKANEYITTNFIANILGLGWAATPAGLQVMEALGELEEERRKSKVHTIAKPRGVASNEMCTFLILNISSLQLISIQIVAYRSQYGSVNPAGIIGAGILATAISTLVAALFCKVMDR